MRCFFLLLSFNWNTCGWEAALGTDAFLSNLLPGGAYRKQPTVRHECLAVMLDERNSNAFTNYHMNLFHACCFPIANSPPRNVVTDSRSGDGNGSGSDGGGGGGRVNGLGVRGGLQDGLSEDVADKEKKPKKRLFGGLFGSSKAVELKEKKRKFGSKVLSIWRKGKPSQIDVSGRVCLCSPTLTARSRGRPVGSHPSEH